MTVSWEVAGNYNQAMVTTVNWSVAYLTCFLYEQMSAVSWAMITQPSQ